MNFWSEIEDIIEEDSQISDPILDNYSEKTIEGESIAPSADKFLFAKNKIKIKKIFYVLCFILLMFSLFLLRLYQLQILKNDYYNKLADGNRIRNIEMKPQRGIILDVNGKQLVNNIPTYYLYYIPGDLPKDLTELNNLKLNLSSFGIDSKKLEKMKYVRNYTKTFLHQTDDLGLISILRLNIKNTSGILIEPYFKREYININSFSHVFGYVGKLNDDELIKYPDYRMNDNIGKAGLELQYENYLKGKSGKKEIEVNFLGKETRVISEEKPIPGHNIQLTISSDFQQKTEEILKKYLEEKKLSKGALVALNPKNGDVLSYISMPTYDINSFSLTNNNEINAYFNDKNNPIFNRVINGKYTPASTFKILMGAMGLEDGTITDKTIINDEGKIAIKNKYGLDINYLFRGWRVSGLGKMDIYSAISKSSDIFFYYLGGGFNEFQGLGIEKIANYLKGFGIDKQTGIDLPNESTGFIPTPEWKISSKNEKWSLGNTYHVSIGQGDVLMTPLQIALYTSYFANNGIAYKPKLVKNVLDENNNLIQELPKQIFLQNFINPKNIEIIRNAMRETVKSGTARSLESLAIQAAGKTGTSEIGDGSLNSIFTVFAPFNNPEIVLTVLIENGGEGSDLAVPIAREILKEYFKNSTESSVHSSE